MNNRTYVQYGSGWSSPKGWRNFDASPTLRFERLPFIGKLYTRNDYRFPENVEYGDIVKGLPIADESAYAVYCSHVLEHLSLCDFHTALLNTKKVLRPGGIFRLVLPDLAYSIKQYLESSSNDAALTFMRETSLGCERRPNTFKSLVLTWLGNSAHLWMWDYKSLEQELMKAGFVSVRRAVYGDSIDLVFLEVEDKPRWDNCLGVECQKPTQIVLRNRARE
jgi:predicted SAM-dependent methyltransferase